MSIIILLQYFTYLKHDTAKKYQLTLHLHSEVLYVFTQNAAIMKALKRKTLGAEFAAVFI